MWLNVFKWLFAQQLSSMAQRNKIRTVDTQILLVRRINALWVRSVHGIC